MTTCPRCGGDTICVGARAFCAKIYRDGGCGTNWVRRGGRWRDDGTRQGEARGDYDVKGSYPG